MSDFSNDPALLLNYALVGVLFLLGLFIWFFVNRSSVRASEQIHLLEQLLEEQKQQNRLLRQWVDEKQGKVSEVAEPEEEEDIIRLIPER